MSLIWADFPSGSQGLYADGNQMVGIWGRGGTIADDPVPTIGGKVLYVGQVDLSDQRTLFAYPTDVTTMIAARRIFISNLPDADGRAFFFGYQNSSGVDAVSVRINASGAFQVYDGGGTLRATSTSSRLLTPGTWHHVEFKATVNGTTLTYEVRLEGVNVLSGSFSSAITSLRRDSFKVNFYTPLTGINNFYLKDFVFCDGTGSANNDFMGTVSVTMQTPDADISLPWTKSVSVLNGYELVNDMLVRGRIYATNVVGTGGSIRVDNTYYAFTTGSVNAGTPSGTAANPWLIKQELTDTMTAANFVAALNATGTAGTTYSTSLTAHPTVAALGYAEFTGYFDVAVQSRNGQTVYTLSSTVPNIFITAMSKNLRADIGYVAAGLGQINTPAVFGLSDMPSDITSVRGIISVARLMKVDGGDASVVLSVGDGTNYSDSATINVGTAPNWYRGVSEINPTTGSPWTPVQANNARIKINRTV